MGTSALLALLGIVTVVVYCGIAAVIVWLFLR